MGVKNKMKIINLSCLMFILVLLLATNAIATGQTELTKIELNTCSGNGELYVYNGDNPFQEPDTSFVTDRDQLVFLSRPKYIKEFHVFSGGTGANAISNSDFESGLSPWKFYSDGSAVLTTETRSDGGNSGRLKVFTPGTNVQVYQKGLTIYPNTKYRLTFDARSDNDNTGADHDMDVYLHKHRPPFTNYGLNGQHITLKNSWNSYTIEFTTTNFASNPVNDGRLRFWYGPYDAAQDKFYLDNVKLTPIADSLPLTKVFDETDPFSVTIHTAQTTPGDTIGIDVDLTDDYPNYGARGVQAYLAQDSEAPIYDDWDRFVVLYSNTGSDSSSEEVYLTAGRHELIIYGDYTINKPGESLDKRDTTITVEDSLGIVSQDTYNQPFPEGLQGVIIHEFSVPKDGMYKLTVETADSIYYSVIECDEPETTVCEGADFVVETDLGVTGVDCHWKGQTYDSEDVSIPEDGTWTIKGLVERGSPSDLPDHCQSGERFHIGVDGLSGPIVEDDPDPCAITLTEEYLGTFPMEAGTEKINMYTDATCPPYTEAESVHVDTLCFYKEGDIPEFGAIAASVALIGAIAGFFILRKRKL